MPKGVEHGCFRLQLPSLPKVQSSPMPKGVEHPEVVQAHAPNLGVQSSPMPKGVEHFGDSDRFAPT